MGRQEPEFRALVEAAPDAMVIVDESGTIVLVNAQTERMFGYRREELLGQSVDTLVPARYRSAHRRHRAGYSGAARPRPMGAGLDLHAVRKDGSEFPVEISLSPLITADRTLIASAIRDITERRQAEAERLRLLRERAAHEEASRIKDEFIATLSHELRTPLNAILGWATLLRAGTLSGEDQERALATIERNAKTQSQLIEDLLDVSRIVTGKLRLRVQIVDFATLIENAVDVVRPLAVARSVALDVVLEARPMLVNGDVDRLQQAIWNVLSNAVKFTGSGGRVSVNLRPSEGVAVLTVRDSGRGIRPDFLPFVFDRFRQADSSYTRQHGGLGLGLAITRSIVELHGGTIRAHSSGEGYGATFEVRIPQTRVVAASDDYQARPEKPHATLTGVRVLAVDDQPDERELLRAILVAHGAIVLVTGSADEALRRLPEFGPDVIITDIAMPETDGYELLRRLRREHRGFAAIPVMALTAHARAEDQERALAAGFQLYMSKPVEPSRVARAVSSLVRQPGSGND